MSWCDWRSWCGLWGSTPLSDAAHVSYKTHKSVIRYPRRYHCHWNTESLMRSMLRLLVPNTSVTSEHVWAVVGGHQVLCGVIYPCHMWYMPYITLMKQCNSISIQVSSSLDHYTTGEVHGSNSWFQKSRAAAESMRWSSPVRCGACLI